MGQRVGPGGALNLLQGSKFQSDQLKGSGTPARVVLLKKQAWETRRNLPGRRCSPDVRVAECSGCRLKMLVAEGRDFADKVGSALLWVAPL